jgi:hypothetical protein
MGLIRKERVEWELHLRGQLAACAAKSSETEAALEHLDAALDVATESLTEVQVSTICSTVNDLVPCRWWIPHISCIK